MNSLVTTEKTEAKISSAQRFLNVTMLLAQIRSELSLIDWADTECNDEALGKHIIAFEQHIDSAIGRCSTIRTTIRQAQIRLED